MTRRRLLLLAAGLSLAFCAVAVVNVWLLAFRDLSAAQIIILFGVQVIAVVTLVFATAAWLETRLLRPLRMLEDHTRLITQTTSHYPITLPEEHFLGHLPQCIETLGVTLTRERNDTLRTLQSATDRLDRRNARLEAILRDLSEGVVVCTLEHRIVLFNHAAASLLKDAGTIGLHRPLTRFFAEDLIANRLDTLVDLYRHHGYREIEQFSIEPVGGSEALIARMALIIEAGASCAGYVLVLSSARRARDADQRRERVNILSPRPEFYDFSLFERPPSATLLARPLVDLDYVAFDTETTGLNPSDGDEIVQIAGVRLLAGKTLADDAFETLVNPGFPIPPQSIRFHGITDDMVTGAPATCDALHRFHTFVDDAILVAHNAAFDMKFLKLKEADCQLTFEQPVLDTLLLSIVLQPNLTAHTLDAIALRFGVDIRAEERHTAIGDARVTAEIFLRMLKALTTRNINTLGEAIEATNSVYEMRRLQEQF